MADDCFHQTKIMVKVFMQIGFFALLLSSISAYSQSIHQRKMRHRRGNSFYSDSASAVNSVDTFAFTGIALKDVVYTSAINYKGASQQLTLDVYKPANAEGKTFPAVVLIHGGSFMGGDKKGLASTCEKLANNGYVAVSIDYRLGWGFISRSATTCNDTNNLKQAMYRAVQDAHAALRYLAKHADEYNIDKNWMFIGGQSAGAITALTTAYLKQDNLHAFFTNDDSAKLGPLYKADDSDEVFTLKGVISMWGAFLNPELITDKTALPTIFFQGQLDKAVPFDSRSFAPCDNASKVYGTYPLYNRLKALGETAIAHVDPQGGHGVFEENFRVTNILCFLNNVRQGIKKQVYLTGVQYSCDKQ
jgi:dienelactone hydrolase